MPSSPVVEMAERPGAALRLIRAALVAGATLAVAMWAHVSAAGNLPGHVGLLVIWAVATLTVAAFTGRQVSLRRMVGLLCAGQAGLHLLLSLVAGHGATATRPVTAEAARYAHVSMLEDRFSSTHAHPGGSADALTSGLGSLLGELTSTAGMQMTAMHLLAAAVVGVYLAAAERLLWLFLRTVAATATQHVHTGLRVLLQLLVVRVVRVVGPAAAAPLWAPVRVTGDGTGCLGSVSRRGPPTAVLSASCG